MIFFLAILSVILVNILWYSWKFGITPTPTSQRVLQALLRALPPSVDGKIVELGAGWGHVAIALAKHYPHNEIEAYEISPIPYGISWAWVKWKGYPRLKLRRKDFFDVSLRDSSLIICYLYPGAMQKLKQKFEEELKTGALVITHTFAIPDWKPSHVYYANDLYRTPVFVYLR